jgi:cytochrome oxidase Cu insertion factor (SCO1/SenC/PrrC family)
VEEQKKKSGMDPRLTVILMVLLFVVPVGAAIVLHSIDGGWKPGRSVNFGELVTPVRALDNLRLETTDSKVFTEKDLQGVWTLFYIDSADCNEQCQENLYEIRQSRLGMGGEKERIQRVMLLTDTTKLDTMKPLLDEHYGMKVVTASNLPAVLKNFEFEKEVPASSAQRVYLIDPHGNLMMRYKAEQGPRDLVKDLGRLLKYSKQG